MPGSRDYTLRLAKQLGFDVAQLEFGSCESGMALSLLKLPLCAQAVDRFELVERDMKTVRDYMNKKSIVQTELNM